jgi:zinc/manganese transport system substrate-binding protein
MLHFLKFDRRRRILLSKLIAAALSLVFVLAQALPASAADGPIAVVAAENFYGDIARQIGGDRIAVGSIISNPEQDPHLFELTPGVVRQVTAARIVILNGAGYDSWMEKLLAATPQHERSVIDAAQLTGYKPGGNPHLWYAPATMPAVATAFAAALAAADQNHADEYAARLKATLSSLAIIAERVEKLKAKHAGAAVTATEPVFGPMAEALALTMRNQRFQLAVMNDTEPSARDVAAFESDLNNRRVKVLIYNSQASDKLTDRLRSIASKAKIPIVGVTETMPANVSYQKWLLDELEMLDKALGSSDS